MERPRLIEAILFYRGEPMTIEALAEVLSFSKKEVAEGLNELSSILSNRGVSLVETKDTVALVAYPEAASFIEDMEKKEREKELSKASLETLTIVLYNAPVSRREIDYIRGVQSQYILRLLTSRGLIEREEKGGGYYYSPSVELLAHLGVQKREDLPEFGTLKGEIEKALETINEGVEDENNDS